jgi:hypothetical protein
MRGEGGSSRLSTNEYSCAHGAQIHFADLTPYFTYGAEVRVWRLGLHGPQLWQAGQGQHDEGWEVFQANIFK